MAQHTKETETLIHRNTALSELPQFLSVSEIENYLNVGRTTAYEYARQHGIRIGRLLRVPREALSK